MLMILSRVTNVNSVLKTPPIFVSYGDKGATFTHFPADQKGFRCFRDLSFLPDKVFLLLLNRCLIIATSSSMLKYSTFKLDFIGKKDENKLGLSCAKLR